MNIVVTGSSSGIGRALSERLVQQGHRVWGLARSDQSKLTPQLGRLFSGRQCDVSEWQQVAAAAESIAVESSSVDALVTCAAIHGSIGPTWTVDPAEWEATIRTNLGGTFNAIRAFAPLLAKTSRRAKIVCFSGGGASKARPNFSAYAAAKTGVVRLVETIAAEEAQRPLDINAVAPGPINTRLTDEIARLGSATVGEAEFAAAKHQLEHGGTPMTSALDLVDWLLSPASDGISGRLLSAPWDAWRTLASHRDTIRQGDLFTLRRIVPEDRGHKF
jgi:NAD(P)-dependent dehydrogenase (short-subunit alcohol dehydrogenase family)